MSALPTYGNSFRSNEWLRNCTFTIHARKLLVEKRLALWQRKAAVRALETDGFSGQRAVRSLAALVAPPVTRRVGSSILRFLPRLRELAARYRRFGYRRLGIMLRREGTFVNHKRLYRTYKSDGSLFARRRKRHVRYERMRDLTENDVSDHV